MTPYSATDRLAELRAAHGEPSTAVVGMIEGVALAYEALESARHLLSEPDEAPGARSQISSLLSVIRSTEASAWALSEREAAAKKKGGPDLSGLEVPKRGAR